MAKDSFGGEILDDTLDPFYEEEKEDFEPPVQEGGQDSFGGTPVFSDEEVERPIPTVQETLDSVSIKGAQPIDPSLARMVGGFTGAAAGAVAGPPGVLLGGALGSEGLGQVAEVYNMFLVDGVEDTLLRMPTEEDAKRLLDRTGNALNNISFDIALNKLLTGTGEVLSKSWKSIFAQDINQGAQVSTKSVMNDFSEAQVDPTAGALGNKLTQSIESTLQGLPPSINTMTKSAQKTFDQISDYADVVTKAAGIRTTPQEAGRRLVKTIGRDGGWVEKSLEKSSNLVEKVQDVVSPEKMISVDNFTGFINKSKKGIKNLKDTSPHMSAPILESFYTDAMREIAKSSDSHVINIGKKVPKFKVIEKESGKLTFNEVSKFRTRIGDLRGRPETGEGLSKKQLKKVYDVLTQDLERAVISSGKEATERWKTSQEFTKKFYEDLDLVGHIADSKTGIQAFDQAFSGARGGAEKLDVIRKAVSEVDKNAWNDLVATKIHKMGRATAGQQQGVDADQFSIKQFLKNYSKIKENGSANILFKDNPGLKKEMERLVRISGSVKDVETVANKSHTGQFNVFANILQGGVLTSGLGLGYAAANLPGAIVGAAVSVMSPYAMGKLMTSKKFVNWLGTGLQIKPSNFNAVKSHLARLALIKEREPELAGSIDQVLGSLNASLDKEKENISSGF